MYNFYFDFGSAILFLAMMFTTAYKNRIKTISNKLFKFVLLLGFISAIADMMALNIQFTDEVMFIAKTIYLFTRSVASLVYCLYIISLTDNIHKFKNKRGAIFLLMIPSLIVFAFLVVNFFNNWFFSIENGEYTRGVIINYGGMYGIGYIYLFISFVYIVKYRRVFKKKELAALGFVYPIVVVSIIIETFFPNLLIEVFASAMTNFIVLNVVERQDLVYDLDTGLKKFETFEADAYKSMVSKKEVTLVYVKVVNEVLLNQKLKYDEQVDYRRTVGNIIKGTSSDFSLKSEYYWLGQGLYVASILYPNEQLCESFAMTLRRRLNVPLKTSFGIIDVYSNVAIATCPHDINTSDKVIAFLNNFQQINGVLDDVLDFSNMNNKLDFEIRMNLSTIIKQAIMNETLEVYYQPIYSTKDNAFTRAEALLRLYDEKFGFISPDLFIPEAERNGTIYKIGDIVFDQVCKFIASDDFKKCGLEKIEVNLSVQQCMHEDLPIHLMDAIKKYGVSPEIINLDITETADAYSRKMMDDNIKILKELGFSFSLDDYGEGYSNMENVSSLPIDAIKVNNQQAKNEEVKVMIDHSIQMIKDLKRKIIVEGVETEEMLNSYDGFLCDYIQGYYFSKPLPRGEFVDFVVNENKNKSFFKKRTEATEKVNNNL